MAGVIQVEADICGNSFVIINNFDRQNVGQGHRVRFSLFAMVRLADIKTCKGRIDILAPALTVSEILAPEI